MQKYNIFTKYAKVNSTFSISREQTSLLVCRGEKTTVEKTNIMAREMKDSGIPWLDEGIFAVLQDLEKQETELMAKILG